MGHWLILSESDVSKALVNLIESKGGSFKSIPQKDGPKSREDFVSLLQEESFTGILHVISADKVDAI